MRRDPIHYVVATGWIILWASVALMMVALFAELGGSP